MSSYAFAVGEESEDDQPSNMPAQTAPAPAAPADPRAARVARRTTSGSAPSPARIVPSMRPGWSGGKPPPGSLQRDIKGRMAESVPDYSDDEDYLRGHQLHQRHEQEERARKRREPPAPPSDDEEEGETEDEGEGHCVCDSTVRPGCLLHGAQALGPQAPPPPPPPVAPRFSTLERLAPPMPVALPLLQRQVAAITGTGPAVEESHSANVSTMMESAVREAFRQGIEQGKRMQLPQLCKTCAIRKERNRLAAKESRHKKRREADQMTTRSLISAAADVAAMRAIAAVTAMPPPPAPAPVEAAGAPPREEELVPPPF